METGTLTSKGQTTIPKAIRDELGLKPGTRLVFEVKEGRIVIRAKTGSIRDAAGLFYDPKRKPVSIEEMNKAVYDEAAERDRRTLPERKRRTK